MPSQTGCLVCKFCYGTQPNDYLCKARQCHTEIAVAEANNPIATMKEVRFIGYSIVGRQKNNVASTKDKLPKYFGVNSQMYLDLVWQQQELYRTVALAGQTAFQPA